MDMRHLFKTNRQLELLAYKLSNDALLLWIVVFFVFTVAEGLAPGLLSSHISFAKLIFAAFIILALIAFFGRRNGIGYEFSDSKTILKNKAVIALLLISLALVVNAVRSMGVFEIIVVSAATFISIFSFYKIFILPGK